MSTISGEPHIVAAPNEHKLNFIPNDAVSSVKFAPDNNKVMVISSWDCSVRVYDVSANSVRATYGHQGPVLDCDFLQDGRCVSAGLDQCVKCFDITSQTESIYGQHSAPVRCVEYSPEVNCVVTGSWDSFIKLWDPRIAQCSGSFQQPSKVYTMSTCGPRLVVGTAGRKVLVWDLRNMNQPEQKRDSSLKYQTRCIRTFPSREGYVLSSIEGRVAVEYLDPHPEVQKRKYAFKCHRVREDPDGVELVYPVNAIAFNPVFNTFATGGSDAMVNVWDPLNKKRLCQFHKYPTTITALAFSDDGTMLAIASSYMFEMGGEVQQQPEDCVYIRKVNEAEVRPKLAGQ